MISRIDKNFLILGICVVILIFSSWFFLKPQIAGDGLTYLETINFLETGEKPQNFIPNRIMTTFAPISIIIFLSKTFHSETGVWFVMNVIFYSFSALIFYEILRLIFEDKKIAVLGTLFMIGNYAIITFGLNYLMDMGGWMFYLISVYFTLHYAKSEQSRDLLLASIFAGIGGLFKEYALLGIIPIATFLIYENRKSFFNLVKKSIVPTVLSSGPIVVLYIYVYLKFDYTYADWVSDSYKYNYSANLLLRIFEYIKSFGSLYNLLAIFVLAGFWVFWKERKNIETRISIFIIGGVLSFLPVFLWGGVTQRILFITVPVSVIIACFFFKKYNKYFYWFCLIFAIYLLLNFFMDSVLLNAINLPF